jgi:hypothetical protein
MVNPRYNISPAIFARNDQMQLWVEFDRGNTISSCAISPALPAGLNFNTSTCVITGAASSNTPAANYTVTITTPVNVVSFILPLEIADRAPAGLNYPKSRTRYVRNVAITDSPPSLDYDGGNPQSYSVSPALPAGLSLDTTTGVISGTPTTLQSATNYTVTATNGTGSSASTLSIAVVVPGTSTIYTADGTEIKAYSVDNVNGDPTYMGKTIASAVGSRLIFHPTHDCAVGYSGTAIESFSINKSAQGQMTLATSIGGVSNPNGIVQTANGNYFFVANSGYVSAYSIDASCLVSFIGSTSAAGGPKEMVIGGDNIYILNSGAGIQHFRHDGSGGLTLTSSIGMQAHSNWPNPTPAVGNGLSLAINTAGTLVTAFDTLKGVETFSVNASTGVLTSSNVTVHNDRWDFRRAINVGDFVIQPFQAFNDGLSTYKLSNGTANLTQLLEGSSQIGQYFAGATGVAAHTSPSGTYIFASYANMARWGARRLKLNTTDGTLTPVDESLQNVVGGY